MDNLFETVKQSITIREAAERYGIEVKRGGMVCCPFHDDKNPSMKLNKEYFYCFGCGATGDVIDLASRLYNLSPKEAAEKLAQDFGLIYDSQAPPRRNYVRQKTETQQIVVIGQYAITPLPVLPKLLCLGFLPDISPAVE